MESWSKSYHAHHSPMGAHSSFTIGMLGAEGGMALEKGSPASSAVFIGYRTENGIMHSFPFSKEMENEAERFSSTDGADNPTKIIFDESNINRTYNWATDCFLSQNISCKIYTPFFSIPDPKNSSASDLKFASCPSTIIEIELHNDSKENWEMFFGHYSSTPWNPLKGENGLKGAVTRESMGFASNDLEVEEFIDFGVDQALERSHTTPNFLLAPVAGLSCHVPAGSSKTIEIVLGYFLSEEVTFNYPAKYWYTRYFSSIKEVFLYTFENKNIYKEVAVKRDEDLKNSKLTDAQKFILAHATRSYFGSTQWLDNGDPIWVVNEGEYLMINTLDLTVDMLFFELKFNPWTVRNVLEQFVTRYSYIDQVFAPNAPNELFDGGISFAHDMGVANTFSPEGYSCYECSGLDRKCFSYMTCEQLTNWILIAGVYWHHTSDNEFLSKHKSIFQQCLSSLLNRDNPDIKKRNGLMGFDSSRTKGGGEITTYDSLDHSLGQARNNVYLAGKCWAAYLALEVILGKLGDTQNSIKAREGAELCAETLTKSFNDELGFIPAVLEEGNTSAIIPAVEALIYPYKMGLENYVSVDGPFGDYIKMLRKHLDYVLKKGVCLYDNGGWKLSSSADNSWMSKICLNQYVVRHILGISYDGENEADLAHVEWEVEGSKFSACSDQFSSGKPIGSLYYPRIVTSILWLDE